MRHVKEDLAELAAWSELLFDKVNPGVNTPGSPAV